MTARSSGEIWPSLPLAEWHDTYATLHMWTQIVGKTRLALAPMDNHWWNVVLYVTARGLTTSPMPYGERTFEVDLDFIDHELVVGTTNGARRSMSLVAPSVADFYGAYRVAPGTRHRRSDLATARRVAEPICLRRGSCARVVRRGRGAALLASARAGGSCDASSFAAASSASAARCTSSGAASTWRARASRAAERHGIPAASELSRLREVEAYSHECISAGWWPGGVDAR